MNYMELREAIAANITNQAGLLDLVTPGNVSTVTKCRPGMATEVEPYQPGNSADAYDAGRRVGNALYNSKSPPQTVDQILDIFHPANIYPAQFYKRTRAAIAAAGALPDEYFNNLDQVANEIESVPC